MDYRSIVRTDHASPNNSYIKLRQAESDLRINIYGLAKNGCPDME
jgi:hypothetical protein